MYNEAVPVTGLQTSQRTLVLALLCVASFAVVFNNLIISPILPDISEDLGVRVAVGGLLVTAYAVAGGLAAIFSGPLIDRIGRKPIVTWGMALLTGATMLSAVAPDYYTLMASRVLAGLGVACLIPAVFAAVGDYFAYHERGRAMSWVVTANTGASILGVPVGAFLSGVLSWRLTFVFIGLLCLVFTWLLFRRLPPDPERETPAVGGLGAIRSVVSNVPTLAALASNFLATTYWFVFITYMGAYFHEVYGLATWALGGVTMVMGVGVLAGSNFGGRLSDRTGKRPIILASTAMCGGLMALETTVVGTLPIATGMLLLFASAGGARFTTQQAIMTEMSPRFRGTVMALNASCQQFGIVAGSALGGLVLTVWGYTGLGPAAAILAAASILAYALFVDESRLREEQPSEAEASPVA